MCNNLIDQCSTPRGSTKTRALTSGLRYKNCLPVSLAVRCKVVGRRQLTLSCVAICVAVGEKLRNRIRKGAVSIRQIRKRKSGCFLPTGIEHPLAFWYN